MEAAGRAPTRQRPLWERGIPAVWEVDYESNHLWSKDWAATGPEGDHRRGAGGLQGGNSGPHFRLWRRHNSGEEDRRHQVAGVGMDSPGPGGGFTVHRE